MTKDAVIAILKRRLEDEGWGSRIDRECLQGAIDDIENFVPEECFEEEPTPKKYVYFVSYLVNNRKMRAFTNGTAIMDGPIETHEDIQNMEEYIHNTHKGKYASITVLNYQLLRTE